MKGEIVEIVEADESPTHRSSVPPHNWNAHWLTVREFSRVMGRSEHTVNWWLRNGILADFGIPVCRFRCGRMHSGRNFIRNIF